MIKYSGICDNKQLYIEKEPSCNKSNNVCVPIAVLALFVQCHVKILRCVFF